MAKMGSTADPVFPDAFPLLNLSIMGWTVTTSQKFMSIQNLSMCLFWQKGLCRCNEGMDLTMISSWMRVGLQSHDRCPSKRQQRRRHAEKMATGRGREAETSDDCMSHRTASTRIASRHQRLGEACSGLSLSLQKQPNSANALILDFWPPEL